MPVNSEHKEYRDTVARWGLVRDIVRNEAKNHIRTVDVNDPVRSRQYKDDAILTNFTRLTKDGLVGLVFRKPSVIDIPDEMGYMLDDATGTGLSLEQLSKLVLSDVLQTGRMGLLVDHPLRDVFGSLADDEEFQQLPRIKPYTAESIINWKTLTIGSKTVLSMVVLREEVEINVDEFSYDDDYQYRVLFLNENLVYEQAVYDYKYELVQKDIIPQDANGQVFNYIPFYFCGSENNDWFVDPIPLYDLSVVNLGHYRNSADYEESIFICGQPTPVFGGAFDIEEFKNHYNEIRIGSRAGYYLGQDPYAQFLQASPNQMVDQAMKRKEEQAIAIGARLITPNTGRETAEAAKIRYASQNSILHTIVDNVSMAVEKALQDVARFLGLGDVEIGYELNRQFYEASADPQVIAQQIMLLDREVIAKEDLREYLRANNVVDADRSDNDIENDLETQLNPLEGIDLDESSE